MSREKRIVDHCTIPLERGQLARWQAAACRKSAGPTPELAEWIGPILDAAADYERAVGRSAAELLRLMVPVPLRPLLSPRSLPRERSVPLSDAAEYTQPGQENAAGEMRPPPEAPPGAPSEVLARS